MFADIYKHAADFLAVLLTGCVVKLMDDYLDQDFDVLRGKRSLTRHLGIGTMAYTLLIFAIAVSLNWRISVAFFLAAYMTGMVYEFNTKYILGLTGWQEICIIFLLSCSIVGLVYTLASLFVLLFIQIADDWLDTKDDALTGQRNSVQVMGLTEAWIGGLIFLLLAFYLNARLTLFAVTAAPLAVWLINKLANKRIMP